jgi:hypothetical protein
MKEPTPPPPLACNVDALSPEQRRKHQEVSTELFRRTGAVHDLPNGLRLQFLNDRSTLALITDFVADEELCCPFLNFDVHIKPQEAVLELSLTGPENTREFLKAEFAELLQRETS